MSLKKLFYLLLGSALISLMILGGSALWLNLKLSNNQKVIMNISSLESSRIIIGVTISNLLSKQESILAANTLGEMEDIQPDKNAEQEFTNELQNLYIMVDNYQLDSQLLDSIQKASQTFFYANEQLYLTKLAMITAKEQLKQLTLRTHEYITIMSSNAESLSGILTLNRKTVEQQIESLYGLNKQATKEERAKINNLIKNYINTNFYDAQQINQDLNFNFSVLADLMHQISFETDQNNLVSLRDNQLVQKIQDIHRELIQLNALAKKITLLQKPIAIITNEFNNIENQLLHQPGNLFSMRENLNAQALSLQNTIVNIQKSNKIITKQFNQLYLASSTLKNSLIKQAETINFYGTVFISVIILIVLSTLLGTGGFILRTIGNSLSAFVKIMQEVAEGKGGLTVRLKKTPYEDLNQVSEAFNIMANKLQFIHEHLQELIDQKTDALQAANNNLYTAQHIAQLGYWSYNPLTNTVKITKECASVLGIPETHSILTYQQIMDLVDQEDSQLLQTMITNAFKQKEKFTQEIRFHPPNQPLRWFYLIGQPDTTEPCEKITFVVMDITLRKNTENEIEALNQKLLSSARRAGMADVATSILHNVGNILNSVKVTVGLLHENMNASSFNKLHAINDLLKAHSKDISNYLTNDSKGKLLPEYLLVLIPQIHQEQEKLKQELLSLDMPIQHIEDIVAMQKFVSGVYNLTEKVLLSNVIDLSIQMCGNIFKENEITLYKPPTSNICLFTDKSKIIQIIVNLIQNAKDALILTTPPILKKTITIRLETNKENNLISLFVTDNGEGISPELIEKIFSMGFTTKETGHGFGLHSSALAAKELGGSLQATSQGVGCGATFILELPITNDAKTRRAVHVIE